jgi:hypothetical protein
MAEKRLKSGIRWTEAEVSRLTRLYPITPDKDLSIQFSRSVWGIKGKARQLGLKRDYSGGYQRQYPLSCSRWSTEEMSLLMELFPSTTNEQIAEKIGRTIDAIANKARKMGLRKTEFWSEQEDELLEKLYKTLTYDQLAKRLGRTGSSVKIRIVMQGLECKVENWTEAETDFLRKNQHTKGYQAIADHLQRTYGAVTARAIRIGIAKKSQSSSRKVT